MEQIWANDLRRGDTQFYDDVTEGLTPDNLLASAISNNGWWGGLLGVAQIRSRMCAAMQATDTGTNKFPVIDLTEVQLGFSPATTMGIARQDMTWRAEHQSLCAVSAGRPGPSMQVSPAEG